MNVKHLIDRPCSVCEFHKENGCCKWSCVFEGESKQEPRWIPVSERLPDTDDEVLCWYEYYHWSQEKILPEYGIGQFFDDRWFGEVSVGKDIRVIAWMPLPKPYKAESEKA